MAKPFISNKTMRELEDYLAGVKIREISALFDDANIDCREDFEPGCTGERRSLVRQYLASLDLSKWTDAAKLLKVFEDIFERLEDIEREAPEPYVQEGVRKTYDSLQKWLQRDGLLYEAGKIRPIGKGPEVTKLVEAANKFDAHYLHTQIERMQGAVEDDPRLAIGTAKELVETTCKTILAERGIDFDPGWELMDLVKRTRDELGLAPTGIPDAARAADTIRRLLGNLASVVHCLAELRNPYGTGHGPPGKAKGLQPRHARLAVGSAAALAVFLFETHSERPSASEPLRIGS